MKSITIAPATRLEGHAKIAIFLDEEGNVRDAYYQVTELRGFEKFCQGRPVEEMPQITSRICGVCPGAHFIASSKAVDSVYNINAPKAAHKLRELFLNAHIAHSHILHFYALAGPDFIVGWDAPPEERSIVGVIRKVGLEVGKKVIEARKYAQQVQEIIGGKAIHAVNAVPGGFSKPLEEGQRKKILEMAESLVEFAEFTFQQAEKFVLRDEKNLEVVMDEAYRSETYYVGLVDEKGRVNFYDGKFRVRSPKGRIVAEFKGDDYHKVIAEHVESWSYLKFPYLRRVGWVGLVDGESSGIFRVNALARLNVADGMATPAAQEAYERFFEAMGEKPVHYTLAFNLARVVELIYATERVKELAEDEAITSREVRNLPTQSPSEGVGAIEAPRGCLFHHYWTNEEGVVQRVNLLVATGNNNAAICLSVKKAAQHLIRGFEVRRELLNKVEMAFRAYDPCLACATHAVGRIPLEISVYDQDSNLLERLRWP